MTTTRWLIANSDGAPVASLVCDGDPSTHPDYAEWDWEVLDATEAPLAFDPIRDDLPTLRSYLLGRVKSLREHHKDAGIATGFGPLQTDPDSRTNINGAVQMASILGEDFSIDWRMMDDTVVTFDAAAMVMIGLLVGQHVSACQYRKNALDAEIDAAATIEALEAIDIEAGWPGS